MQKFLHFSLFHIGTAFWGVIGTLNTKVNVHYIETLVLQLKLGNVSRKAKKKMVRDHISCLRYCRYVTTSWIKIAVA